VCVCMCAWACPSPYVTLAMRTNAPARLRSPLFYLGGQLYPSVNSTRPRGQLHPSRRLTLPVWEVSSTRLGG
jgi:hypothetical protein